MGAFRGHRERRRQRGRITRIRTFIATQSRVPFTLRGVSRKNRAIFLGSGIPRASLFGYKFNDSFVVCHCHA